MADGTAWRLVSRCTTVEDVVRVFRALATADGLDGIPVTGAGPAGGTQVRVVLALASKAVVLDGDAVVTSSPGRLGLRFIRLDPRGKGLLAHMVEHRTSEAPPPVPRHLVPLGAQAGTPSGARADAMLATCSLETMAASGPVARPTIPDLASTVRMPGTRREPAPPTIRDSRPPSMASPGAIGAVPAPERPRRETQKTLMGMPTLAAPAPAPAPVRAKAPSAPPPPAELPSASSPGLVVAAGTPTGVPTESVPVPRPRAGDAAETGPTQPTRGPSEPSPVIKLAAQALTAPSGPASVPSAFDAVPTVPTPVPNIRAMVPSRIEAAPSGPVDDLPTVPHDDIQTDVAVALPDLPGSGEDFDPVVDPPTPSEPMPMVMVPQPQPGAIPVYAGPGAAPYAAPPAPYYPPAAPPAPAAAPYYTATSMAPQAVAPPRVYPPTAQLPALQPAGYWPPVPEGVERDEDMTEMVALVRPPRRRWPVIAVTSAVIVIGVAVMVYLAARAPDDDDAAAAPAPSAAPAVKPPPAPPPTDPTAPPVPVDPSAAARQPVVDPAPPAGTCTVTFTSSPDAAEVVVGGAVIGTTPFDHAGPCAGYIATFRRARYQSHPHKVEPGATTAEVRLERPSFKVRVTSRPAGAMVKIAGVDAGKTPVVIKLPGYETTSIDLHRAGYAPTSHRVYAGKSGTKVDVKLKPRRR